MAVWTDGSKILNWIDFVGLPNGRKLHDVMNVDEAFSNLSVLALEVEATHNAAGPEVLQTGLSRLFVAFKCVYDYSPATALGECNVFR